MEHPGDGGRQFQNFYANHSGRKKKSPQRPPSAIPDKMKSDYSGWSDRHENDVEQFHNDLFSIFASCGYDADYMDALRSQAGSPEDLILLYKAADKSIIVLPQLIHVCNDVFKGEAENLYRLAKAVGGCASLMTLLEEEGENHVRELLNHISIEKLSKMSLEELSAADAVESHQKNLIEKFCGSPSEANLRILFRSGLIRGGEVMSCTQVKSGFSSTLSVHGQLSGNCRVLARWSATEKPPVKVTGAQLIFEPEDGPLQQIDLKGDLLLEFADGYVIWMYFAAEQSANREEWGRRKERIASANFIDLPSLTITLAGGLQAYQTKGDLADSAHLKSLGLSCFSFSSRLGGDLAGIWVLHAHCVEKLVDDDGNCLAFEILAVSLKLAALDREVESTSTMKVTPGEIAGESAGKDEKAQALNLFIAQRKPILELAEQCSKQQILSHWNECKAEIQKGASHATLYDRHNVADPTLDLAGWLNTVTTHRIKYLFFSKSGLAGHLKVLRDEIGRFVASARAASAEGNGKLMDAHRLASKKIINSLCKSAEFSTTNKPINGVPWEDFDFEIDIDLGPFGRHCICRAGHGEVAAKAMGSIDDEPHTTIDRMFRFIYIHAFVSPDALSDCIALLQQDATALGDAIERARSTASQRGEISEFEYTVTAGVEEFCNSLSMEILHLNFDFNQFTLVFGPLSIFKASRRDGNPTSEYTLKDRKK